MDFPSILLENAFDSYASQNRYNSRSHNFSYILFWPFNRFLPIDSKFCNFQVHFWLFCPKNPIFGFEFSNLIQNFPFCHLTEFLIFYISKKFLAPKIGFFGQNSQKCTWKLQNLESMDKNLLKGQNSMYGKLWDHELYLFWLA